MDKTGPEGNIDSLMLHGQGNIYNLNLPFTIISVRLFLVSDFLNYNLL